MPKASLTLTPTDLISQLDRRDWTREQWKLAYAMARRMVRTCGRHSASTALTWYFDHGVRRFGAPAFRLVRAAGWIVFERRTVCRAASGSVEDLARQGLIRFTRNARPDSRAGIVAYRCADVERMWPQGFNLAWTWDPLAALHSNRALRVQRAQRLRAQRSQVEYRYALTPAGQAALRAAGLATDPAA